LLASAVVVEVTNAKAEIVLSASSSVAAVRSAIVAAVVRFLVALTMITIGLLMTINAMPESTCLSSLAI
jgi:hypothetical protein